MPVMMTNSGERRRSRADGLGPFSALDLVRREDLGAFINWILALKLPLPPLIAIAD